MSRVSRSAFSFGASGDSRTRERRMAAYDDLGPGAEPGERDARPLGPGEGRTRRASKQERGLALVIAMTAIAILAVMLADMHESTTSAYVVATTERDQLRAEYMAKSAINLTRLLIAQEPAIRTEVTYMYQLVTGRPPPMLMVVQYADGVLAPFCRSAGSGELGAATGIDFSLAEGLGDTHGTCEISGFPENGLLNLSDPLNFDGTAARTAIAQQTFALMGGYQSPSPYDPLFEQRDADGQYTSRLDVVSALIDWWDYDTERTTFDPGASTTTSSGAEDDVYRLFDDPYSARNAPLDSLEELRLVRGVGDDFWATFIEPDPEDPTSRMVTIYGSGAVNPNAARPEVILARVCSILVDQPLCTDYVEAQKFIQVMATIRGIAPIPWFTRGSDFINFIEGRGGARDLYPMLQGFLGADNPILFRPVTVTPERRIALDRVLVTAARIFTIQATGRSGRATVRIRTVMNFHERWTPPPPNAGTMPGMGIFIHYRVD